MVEWRNNHKGRVRLHFVVYAGLWAVMVLAGCGSGGGTPLAITQQNSPQVVGASYGAADSLTGTSSFTTTFTSLSADVGGGVRRMGLAGFAQRQIIFFEGHDYGVKSVSTVGVSASDTIPCNTPPSSGPAGSVDVSANIADINTVSSGDSLHANFHNCYESSVGATLDGGMSLTFGSITGDPTITNSAYTLSASFSFDNLAITDNAGKQSANGDMSISEDTSDGINVATTLKGSSISFAQSGGPSVKLENYNLSATDNNNTSAYSLYGSGRVTDSDLGGYVDFAIDSSTPFEGVGTQNPASGTMTITGADKSSIRVSVIDTTSVQLQVDADGDGIYESTDTKSWSDLAV